MEKASQEALGTEVAEPERAAVASENVVETQATTPAQPLPTANRDAWLVHIYPAGPWIGTRHLLGDAPLIVGRDPDCHICLEEPSISRHHAEIRPGMAGHYVVDLQSTNGTFINDRPASIHKLKQGDYLRFSNFIFRYLAGGSIEAKYHEELYRLTIIDGLTGVHNKRYFLEFLDRELARSARHRRPVSLLLFDIDHFKALNDAHGHLGGDCILRELTQCIKGAIRKEELFARYGGEEFALVLPETDHDGACCLAQRVRQQIAEHAFHFDGKTLAVTISIGIVTTEGDAAMSPTELIRLADEKLYEAKDSGRNCVRS